MYIYMIYSVCIYIHMYIYMGIYIGPVENVNYGPKVIQGGEDAKDAVKCLSLSATEALIIELCCGT